MTSGKDRRRRTRNGINGSVYPRGKTWAYVVDLGPDPLTGERRRDARSGFLTEDDAWSALVAANGQLRANRYIKNAPRTVRQFFDEWLTAIHSLGQADHARELPQLHRLLRCPGHRRAQSPGDHPRDDHTPVRAPAGERPPTRRLQPADVRALEEDHRRRAEADGRRARGGGRGVRGRRQAGGPALPGRTDPRAAHAGPRRPDRAQRAHDAPSRLPRRREVALHRREPGHHGDPRPADPQGPRRVDPGAAAPLPRRGTRRSGSTRCG